MHPEPIQTWHDLVKRRDATGLDALLADEVTFHSPVVHTPQQGKAITTAYLTAALHVFGHESFEYVREVIGERDAVLEFKVTLGDTEVNGVDMIHWTENGQIDDFKVLLRPIQAVNLIHQMMGQMLAQGASKG